MISLQNVSFGYEKNPVIKGVSYAEQEPVITGLWGRNGAGKTTLMKLIAGHLMPREGSIEIMGHTPYNHAEAQKHLCYMQEDHPFSEIWTIRDALRFYRYFKPNWNQEMAERMVDTFKLPQTKKTKKLSTGMKTALQVVIGLASQAEVTILDEPTNGLDAGMRKKFYELLLESYDMFPRMIMVSTHQIEELQLMLESIVIVNEGRLLLHESMETVREKGIWLTGPSSVVTELARNTRILHELSVGPTKKVMIDAVISDEWGVLARTHSVTVEKAHLQDYLLYKTENVGEAMI